MTTCIMNNAPQLSQMDQYLTDRLQTRVQVMVAGFTLHAEGELTLDNHADWMIDMGEHGFVVFRTEDVRTVHPSGLLQLDPHNREDAP